MPVYEYECKACHQAFEYQQRMSDPEKTVCEACGGALERLISRTAFQLKGGGWYKDLYSSSKPANDGSVKPTPVESIKASEGAPSGDGSAKSGSGDSGGGDSGGSTSSSSSDKPKSSATASAS